VAKLMALLQQRPCTPLWRVQLDDAGSRGPGSLQELLVACLEVLGERAFVGILDGLVSQLEGEGSGRHRTRASADGQGECGAGTVLLSAREWVDAWDTRQSSTPEDKLPIKPAPLQQAKTKPIPRRPSGERQQLWNVEADYIGDKLELHRLLADHVPGDAPDAEEARRTLTAVGEVLANGVGGVIVAVIDGQLWNTVRFHHLDDGHLTRCFSTVAKNLHEQTPEFLKLLEAFSAHGGSDRWQHEELERLVEGLPEAAESLAKLEGNPKDGAFVISYRGNIMGAAGHLKYASERWQLLKSNGKHAGTRHASSLAFAEWLGTEGFLGVVFVRSDDGGVHAFLPRGKDQPPRVLHFDSLQPCSQAEMLKLFRERIVEKGRLMRKTRPGLIRQGKRGERVMTVVNGRITSDVKIEDDTSMVVRAPTVDQELYVLSRDKFEANWALPGQVIPDDCWENRQLSARGFMRYMPKPGIFRWIYEIELADVANVPTACFVSSWGAQQPLKQGDFLAMPATKGEIYLMPVEVVCCYSECTESGALVQDRPEDSERPHPTQQEMLQLFRPLILEHGRLMQKVKPALVRPGKMGERVVTCVAGRVTSEVVITDGTSMVVRAPTAHHELYTLSREKFEANWVTPGEELGAVSPKSRLLRSQGFARYKPKPHIRRHVYRLGAEDLKLVPTRCFLSSWGAPQPVQEGDFLAMPAPAEHASEVYLMPSDCVSCYVECAEDDPGSPSGPAHKPRYHRTQQEVVEFFKPRILEGGRALRKMMPALIRPGKLGERVVTCIDGRVICDMTIKDETSVVVRAPTLDRELYVLSREQFEEHWVIPGAQLSQSSPVKRLLHSQGFMEYDPKPGTFRYVYTLTGRDVAFFPSGFFYAPGGALQPVREGDCLAMPGPAARAEEVYLVHPNSLVCFEEWDQGGAGNDMQCMDSVLHQHSVRCNPNEGSKLPSPLPM